MEVVYEDNVMKLADRSCLAGSAATTDMLVRNMYKEVGVPIYDAVKMASSTPARVIGIELAKMIADAWLGADFEGGRHLDRVNMLE